MSNAYLVVKQFEQAIAEYANAPYAISVDSCSSALFLCCEYENIQDMEAPIEIPRFTYPSVAAAIIHAGGKVVFTKNNDWQENGWYNLKNTRIMDSAKKLCRGMYRKPLLICLSFHGKKCLKIGRGGMILTDSKKAYDWFKLARFDGRHECPLSEDTIAFPGWNMYLSCEQAARGLELLQWLPDENIGLPDVYPDLSKYKFYTEANR